MIEGTDNRHATLLHTIYVVQIRMTRNPRSRNSVTLSIGLDRASTFVCLYSLPIGRTHLLVSDWIGSHWLRPIVVPPARSPGGKCKFSAHTASDSACLGISLRQKLLYTTPSGICICVCVYIYIYTHTYYVYTHICIYAYIYIYTHM